MSVLQEMQSVRRIIEDQRSELLEIYCEQTGADMGKVIYTLEGWDEFMEWIAKQYHETLQKMR